MPAVASAALAFYTALGLACALTLFTTLSQQPLFPLQMSNLEWTAAWLKMTVVDYYGAALPLCGIAISSDAGWSGWLWSIGFCLGGSPFCCAYVVLRLVTYREEGLLLRY
jgi:hypothetical protein